MWPTIVIGLLLRGLTQPVGVKWRGPKGRGKPRKRGWDLGAPISPTLKDCDSASLPLSRPGHLITVAIVCEVGVLGKVDCGLVVGARIIGDGNTMATNRVAT